MRLLHTSDWHLGRSFHRENLHAAQRVFLDHLVATAAAERVDAVLVAGDVYDRALPGLEAVALFDEVLWRLAELGVPTVFVSGNHDSARRLGVASRLIDRAGIHLRTDPDALADPVLLADAHGPVAVYGLPYLEPALVRERLGVERGGHEQVLAAAMDRVRADLAARPAGTRAVVLAHAFVTGGAASDSERDIAVGGVQSVPAEVFDGVHYAALGHLHGCQTLAPHLRYSGSPLAYSFSEADHEKSMWLVDLDAAGAVEARRILCPVPRRLARLEGRLDDLLTDGRYEYAVDRWVQATLTDPVRPADAMERLRARFPHTLNLLFEPEGGERAAEASYARRVRGRTDQEVVEGFVAHVRPGRELDGDEQSWLLEGLESVRRAAADRAEENAR
ncbi:exonuclease SbcCD subunit D [Kitasatospora sp. YST-16]|uniref:exonuclease SbcCD subunit D n=1 Tax=Kitasatospora sp. YST-16 TaxID=2998080 RepID=UPI00228490B4|nr:exonuclease SbcCD subunit D [Kitasatospora sp. YST-16]WAL75168.1 exonuclease SbcCD subunit D [Kitasatospora sp. YST-16]WNW41225.1 exonuclease SbcCD subunit D [Streptomyces sp. Li-HN-5-13]